MKNRKRKAGEDYQNAASAWQHEKPQSSKLGGGGVGQWRRSLKAKQKARIKRRGVNICNISNNESIEIEEKENNRK